MGAGLIPQGVASDKFRQSSGKGDYKKCTLVLTMEKEPKSFDLLIVGGGPAGMSAALWGDELGFRTCLIEASSEPGGQLHMIHNPIRNHLGNIFRNGEDCYEQFHRSLSKRKIEIYPKTRVAALDTSRLMVSIDDGRLFAGKAILLATGLRRRRLGIPGEADFDGKGILDSGAKDPGQVRGQRVAVVGGGDAALENALILAEHASKVHLIHRRYEFAAREEFRSAISAKENIETKLNYTAVMFGGDDELKFVEIKDGSGGTDRLDISKAIVRIGYQPNTEMLDGAIRLDERGYIVVDAAGQTSREGIYAAGDAACEISPTISSAVGSAATAVKAAAQWIRSLE